MVKNSKNKQLSLDLGYGTQKSLDAIAYSFNQECDARINNIGEWPGNIICILGEENSGAKSIFDNWCNQNNAQLCNQISDIQNNDFIAFEVGEQIDETLLFNFFQSAENNNTKALIWAKTSPKDWQISIPDLLSRTNSLPILMPQQINENYFLQILVAIFEQFGIKTCENDIKGIFSREICSFALLSKIFSHISMLSKQNDLPKFSAIKLILREIATNEMNKDLFDDASRN